MICFQKIFKETIFHSRKRNSGRPKSSCRRYTVPSHLPFPFKYCTPPLFVFGNLSTYHTLDFYTYIQLMHCIRLVNCTILQWYILGLVQCNVHKMYLHIYTLITTISLRWVHLILNKIFTKPFNSNLILRSCFYTPFSSYMNYFMYTHSILVNKYSYKKK